MNPARSARSAVWIAAGMAAILASACSSKPGPCVVTGVVVEEAPGPSRLEALGMERDELRRIALDAFARTPGFQVPTGEPGKGARRCRGRVSLLDARLSARPGGPLAEVIVRMDVVPGDDADAWVETVRGSEAVEPGEAVGAAFRRAIRAGADRAASALALALAEAAKPDEEVIRDLESGDPRLRELAVGVLADRKNPAAVPGLITRLRDPDPEVADRAVGALAQIGDPRAVGPIVELARRREGPFVAQMVRAVGDIGGVEAEAYLETLTVGHPDPLVREAAREALKDARRRAAAGKVRSPGK